MKTHAAVALLAALALAALGCDDRRIGSPGPSPERAFAGTPSATSVVSEPAAAAAPAESDRRTGEESANTNSLHANPDRENSTVSSSTPSGQATEEVATLGAGCFWCVEAVFQQLKGVRSVQSGYSGGQVPNPTYEQVSTKTTGHAEVCQIRFDPSVLSFDELLEVFWAVHDPTTPNRQGADVGPQYRSVIFYHSEQQRAVAEKYKQRLNEEQALSAPVVTEISPYTNFYPAEDYHQNFYRSNPLYPYCRVVIQPKVEKLHKVFAERLKQE